MFKTLKNSKFYKTICALFVLILSLGLFIAMPSSVAYADTTSTVSFSAIDGTVNSKAQENYDKAFDGRKSGSNFTKWCYEIAEEPFVIVKASESVRITGYVFTSGNDNADATKGAGRNPKTWTFYGSSDYNETTKAGTWTVIDSKTNDTTMQDINFADYTFNIQNNKQFYQYYKFQFTAVQGESATLFQLSEIALNYSLVCLHDWEIKSTTAATCTEPAKNNRECKICHETDSVSVGTANGHQFGSLISQVPATCTTNGTKEHKHCSVCNNDFDSNDVKIDDLTIYASHNFGDWNAKVPETCTTNGTKAHKECQTCHKYFDSDNTEISDITIPPAEHDWGSTVSYPATCTNFAYDLKICQNCSAENKTFTSSTLGHEVDTDGNCSLCLKKVPYVYGELLILGGTLNQDYSCNGNTVIVSSNTKIRISQVDPSKALTDYAIKINSSTGANVTLAGLNLDFSAKSSGSPLNITTTADVEVVLILEKGTVNTFKSGENYAGIQKTSECTLIIDGAGTLNAYGNNYAPGIGGNSSKCSGKIRILGGIININGGAKSNGIGSGLFADMNDKTGVTDISIEGGQITAKAGTGVVCCQAIGGFNSIINISGGSITAHSDYGGAAIGGDISGEYPKIKITGGSINNIVYPYAYSTSLDPYANDFGYRFDDSQKIYPKNANNQNLYELSIYNRYHQQITIDGINFPLTEHSSSDSMLYLWLTGESHTIKMGNKTYQYTFNSETETFNDPSTTDITETKGLSISGTLLSNGYDYSYEGKVLKILSDEEITISSGGLVTTDIIWIKKNISANIILDNVYIDVSAFLNTCALMIEDDSTATVTITIKDGTTSKLISGNYCAGLQKNGSTGTLVIQGGGSLYVKGGKNSAGIGGSDGHFATNITIKNKVLTAIGGESGSGIGGGSYNTATNIIIDKTSVKAVAGNGAENIGCGYLGGKNCGVKNLSGDFVYLFTLENSESSQVSIDSVSYGNINQLSLDSTDYNFYLYLTGENHTVTIGENSKNYHFNANQFIKCQASENLNHDENGHWNVCVVGSCDTKFNSVSHTFSESVINDTYFKASATCTSGAIYYKSCICGECGDENSTFVSGNPIEHDWDDDWYKNNTQHYHKCKDCDATKDSANHSYSTTCDVDCDICSFAREESSLVHDFSNSWLTTTTGSGHYHKCRNCEATSTELEHNFVWIVDTTDTSKHMKYCEDCCYKDSTTKAEHTYEYKNTEDWHWQQCTLCSKELTRNLHTYDNNCATICNQEGCGYDRHREQHAEDWVRYTHGKDSHTKKCYRCNTILEVGTHTMQHKSNDNYHWEECVCGYSTEKLKHRYENSEATECRICGHECLQLNNISYSLSGFSLNSKIKEVSISPLTDDGLLWNDEYCKYGEHWWIISDLENYIRAYDKKDYIVNNVENAYFSANKDYWLGFYLYADDGYDIYTLGGASIKVDGIEHIYLDYIKSYGTVYAFACIKLPRLTGNSTITAISQLEYSISNLEVDLPVSGFNILPSASNLSGINVEIEIYKDYNYNTPITDTTTLFDLTSNWEAGIYLSAPENYSFLGFTAEMLTINGLIGDYEFTVSAGGGIIKLLCPLLPTLYPEHTHDEKAYYDDSTTHTIYCENCGIVIEKNINHVYDNNEDTDCNVCGYKRILYIESIEMSLTGYEIGAKINNCIVSLSSTRGIDWNNAAYYQDWFVSTDFSDLNTIIDTNDNGVFITGKQYWLGVIISTSSDDYWFSNNLYNNYSNITLTGIGNPEYISGYYGSLMIFFKLPQLTGTDPTQKINELELSLSNYQINGLIKDTTFVYDTNKIESIEIELIKNDGASINLESDETYNALGKYEISFTITAKSGYTLDGFTLSGLDFENSTQEMSIIISPSGSYAMVVCKLKTLASEHTCNYSTNYLFNETLHYKYCETCFERTNEGTHIYDNDEDMTCNTCSYTRKLYVNEIEFTLNGYEYQNIISYMYITTNSVGIDNTKYAEYGVSFIISQDELIKTGLINEFIEDDYSTKFERLTKYYIMLILQTKANYYLKDMSLSNISLNGYKAVYYSEPSAMTGGNAYAVFELPLLTAEHTHSGTWVDEIPATCISKGTKGHYECDTCHRYFAQDDSEIFDLTIAKNPNNHRESEYLHDENKHWQICPDCGEKAFENFHHGGTAINGQKRTCEDCSTQYGKYMITSLDFTMTGYELDGIITDINLTLSDNSGIDFSKHSYDSEYGWFIITDINRFYNDRYWERDDFIYVVDDANDKGWFLPNKKYYLYVRIGLDNLDEYDYSLINDYDKFKVNGMSGDSRNFFNQGYFIQNYFELPRLAGTSAIVKASDITLQLNGHTEDAVVMNTTLTETSTTKMLDTAPTITVYKDGTAITDNTIVYDTTSRFTFDIVLTAKSGYTFEGFTTDNLVIDGIGKPDSIKVSASGGKLLAHFRMKSLMGEHEHIYDDYIQTENQHWYECNLCFEHLNKGDHVYTNGEDVDCNICNYKRTFYFEEIEFNIDGYAVDELITDISLSATSLNSGAIWKNNGKYGVSFDYVITSFYSYSQNRKDYVDVGQVAYFMPNIEYTLFLYIYAKDGNYSFKNLQDDSITLNNARYRKHEVTKEGDIEKLYVVFDMIKLTSPSTISKAPKQTFSISGYEKGAPINDAVLSLSNSNSGTKIVSTKFIQDGNEILTTGTDCFDETKKLQIKVVLDITGRYTFFGFTEDDFELADGYRFSNIEINTSGSQITVVITAKSLMGEHEHSYGDWAYDKNNHWHECSKCFAYIDNGKHIYDNDKDTICNTCGYERKLDVKTITLVLTGYEYGSAVSNTTLKPIESQKSIVACGEFGEEYFFGLDDGIFELEPDSIISDGTYTFVYNNEYYILAIIAPASSVYTFDNVTSISLQNYGEAVQVLPLSGYDMYFVFFKLPALVQHIHDLTWVVESPATCVSDGIKGHYECSGCDEYLDENKNKIDDLTITKVANAHKYGEWQAEIPATCTSNGTKAHKTCEYCHKHFDNSGSEISDLTISIKPNNHRFGNWIDETEATEENVGIKAHKDCLNCHKHFDENGNEIDDLEIPKLIHQEQDKSLSAGAIVGIATAGTAVAGIGGFSIVWFVIKKKKFSDLIVLIKGIFKK